MSDFLLRFEFSESGWEQLTAEPRPRLDSLARGLGEGEGEPVEIGLFWPSEGIAYAFVRGPDSISERLAAAATIGAVGSAQRLPTTSPPPAPGSAEAISLAWAAVPSETGRCKGCGREEPPHAEDCEFA